MARYSPALAYWYLRKQQQRRASAAGATPPASSVSWGASTFVWGAGNTLKWGT